MGSTIDFIIPDVNDSTDIITNAYVNVPEGPGPFPGVVVAFHKDGIDDFTKWVVDDLAGNGYAAIAPNHYHALPPGMDIERRREFLADEQMALDLKSAADWLEGQKKVDGDRLALLGHCMGGRTTWLGIISWPKLFKCGCPFYSGNTFGQVGSLPPPATRMDAINAPVMGFFGNDDTNPSPEDVDQLEEILMGLEKEHEFHRYDGAGHAFMGGPKYREHAARDAWTKTLKFLSKHIGGHAPDVASVFQ